MVKREPSDAGWSTLDALTALLVAGLCLGSIASAGHACAVCASRLSDKAVAAIEDRNAAVDAFVALASE